MTFPPPYTPPPGGQTTVGLTPATASDVNISVGTLLRQFTQVKERVNQQHAWMVTVDLKIAPYNMTAEDETLIKSALADLDTTLDTVDMTFISRLIGLV